MTYPFTGCGLCCLVFALCVGGHEESRKAPPLHVGCPVHGLSVILGLPCGVKPQSLNRVHGEVTLLLMLFLPVSSAVLFVPVLFLPSE